MAATIEEIIMGNCTSNRHIFKSEHEYTSGMALLPATWN